MARVASAADSAAAPAALLRVTVASTHRRVDLMLPGCWPVADLLPELARSVGVLDVRTVHAGYRLVTAAGRELDDQRGLVAQDVTDGAILTVLPGDQLLEARHDDTAEAMAQAVHTTVPAGRCRTVIEPRGSWRGCSSLSEPCCSGSCRRLPRRPARWRRPAASPAREWHSHDEPSPGRCR